jgi:RimJ/RimL family protein N-acetyltransferase
MNFSKEIILENNLALLRPMQQNDAEGFSKIAFNPDIWEYTTTCPLNLNDLNDYINNSLIDKSNQLRYPFTIIDKRSGEIAGSTSYGNVSLKDKRLEIGWTWLGKKFMGTGLNKECKFLLLQYAFEELKFERVEFKTDVLNKAARKALEKIGAKEEGVMRSHMVLANGRRRDSIYYSVLSYEWKDIKEKSSSTA